MELDRFYLNKIDNDLSINRNVPKISNFNFMFAFEVLLMWSWIGPFKFKQNINQLIIALSEKQLFMKYLLLFSNIPQCLHFHVCC